MITTPRGGARQGAGRPPRKERKSLPIWCGQMSAAERTLIIQTLTPDERHQALAYAVDWKLRDTLKGWLD